MLPPTHLLFSYAWSKKFHSKRNIITLACCFGAFIPDMPYGIELLLNYLFDNHPIQDKYSSIGSYCTTLLHTLIIWLLFYFIIYVWRQQNLFYWIIRAFLAGGISHIFLDSLTHGQGNDFHGCNYFWPLNISIVKIVSIWNYRHSANNLWPKSEELFIDAILMIYILQWSNPWKIMKKKLNTVLCEFIKSQKMRHESKNSLV